MKSNAKQEPPGAKWGGARKGAGRKSQWPTGTTLKSMRLPASLEAELKQFARDRLSGSLEKVTKPRRTRRRRSKTEEITLENAAYWIVIHKDTDEVLADTLARDPVDAIGRAEDHFGKLWLKDIEPGGWEIFPVAVVLPNWRGTDLGLG